MAWTAPSSNGGSAITGYLVTPYVGTTAQPAQTFTGTATTQIVTGLNPGTTLHVHGRRAEPGRTGRPSAKSAAVTLNNATDPHVPRPGGR